MTEYFKEDMLIEAKEQKKKVLINFFVIAGAYLIISAILLLWFTTLPYGSPLIDLIKFVQYVITIVIVIISAAYLGIKYKRVRKYCDLLTDMFEGVKEEYTGNFLEYDESVFDKGGVDMKSLVFVEWNKYKNDFFERKVNVFSELPFPQIEQGKNVKYITQNNVLVSYEILS